MVGLTYDSTRKLSRVQKFKKTRGGDDKNMMSQYQPVPYNIGFTLYAMAKNSDDEFTNCRTNIDLTFNQTILSH